MSDTVKQVGVDTNVCLCGYNFVLINSIEKLLLTFDPTSRITAKICLKANRYLFSICGLQWPVASQQMEETGGNLSPDQTLNPLRGSPAEFYSIHAKHMFFSVPG